MADNEQQIPTALAGVQQVPTQGADTEGTAPPASAASILGGGGLETMVAGYLKHITDVQANSPLAVKNQAIQQQKAAAAATPVDTSKPAQDNDQPAPGSMGSKLMGALGDASHATDKPGGWLQGISNTVNARNQRLEQEKKDQILMARTQAETVAMHRNMHRQDEESQQAFQKANQHFVDTLSLNHDTEEASFADVQKRMKDKDFASNHYVREIGSEPVSNADGSQQKDQYGNPVTTPRYAIIAKATKDGQPDDHEVKPEWSADVKRFHGTDIPAGTKLTTGQFASLDTTLTADRNAVNILGNNRGKPLSDDEIKTLRPYITDPTVQSAISHTPGDAYGGVQEQIANGDQHIANAQQAMATAQAQKNQPAYDWAKSQLTDAQEEQQKLKDFAAAAFTTKQVDAYNKKSNDVGTMITDLQKKANGAHGEDAAAIAAATKSLLDDPKNAYTDQQKSLLNRVVAQTTAAAKASQEYDAQKEKSKTEANNALVEGDIDGLVDAALNYQLDPNKLYSMRKNTNAEFKAKMLAKDPTYSEATYKQRYNMQQDLAKDTPTSMGGQVDSLNRFALHTGTANRGIEGLRNIGSPILNTPLNKIKSTMTGFPEAQAFKIEAETAKDEYLNFIKNGHVPPTAQEERLASMINENRTPAELQETMRAMAELVGARAKTMNGRYNTIMGGGSIPGLLQPDSESVLRQFGVDVDAIRKPNEVTSFSRPIDQKNQAAGKPTLPTAPAGQVSVQIPGSKPGFISKSALAQFKKDHPNATVSE